MLMKFTALEIGSGDAFLLQDNERNTLFDAGGSKSKIVKVLKDNEVSQIDLAICSHNDKDHANGFIGLLMQPDICIKEIWLPGIWASIVQYVIDHRSEFHKIWPLIVQNNDKYEECYYTPDDLFGKEFIQVKDFNNKLSSSIEKLGDMRIMDRKSELKFNSLQKPKRGSSFLCANFDRILKIVKLACEKGVKMSWFEPTNVCVKNVIDYGFVALNSKLIRRVRFIKDPMAFLHALTLTEANKHSLVFEYIKNDIPVVRFSADSDCICQSVTPQYTNNIIVTAPHHGSAANANVYTGIQGQDIIWVRSDGKTSNRPCDEFKKLPVKYCLVCQTNGFKTEISFEYDFSTKKWGCLKGKACQCKIP